MMSVIDDCGRTVNRTRDTQIFSLLLYQLSYPAKRGAHSKVD